MVAFILSKLQLLCERQDHHNLRLEYRNLHHGKMAPSSVFDVIKSPDFARYQRAQGKMSDCEACSELSSVSELSVSPTSVIIMMLKHVICP